jgi:hypothetical protein
LSLSRIVTIAGVTSTPIRTSSVAVSVTLTVSSPSTMLSSIMPVTSTVAVSVSAGMVTLTGNVV